MNWLISGVGIFVLLFAILWPWFWPLTCVMLITIFAVSFGAACTVWAHIYLSSQHQTPTGLLEHIDKDLQLLRDSISNDTEKLPKPPPGQQPHLPVVFGRTVDGLLQQLIELILRDFLISWLKEYTYKPEVTIEQFKEDLWGAVQDLYERISRVDGDKLIACDMITKITMHFEKIRIAHSCVAETNKSPAFSISPYLMSPAAEMHFMRQVSELFIMFLLPRCYSLAPATHLLREVLACKILQPAVNMITEPDYLNQKVLNYLEAQRAAAAVHNRTHEYARSFEDFLKLIQNCNDVDTLKRIRYNIVNEIMQATTLQNMSRARGVEVDAGAEGAAGGPRATGAGGPGRREMAAARKLRRYITQLSYAKAQCESALTAQGWDGPFPSHDSDSAKVLSLATILESVLGRRHLSTFLETLFSQGLVGYWTAVEELRSSPRSNWHQLGAEIFYTYIRSPSAEIKVDKETRKRMEAFLLGDKGPEVFYEVQNMVLNTLQDKYYQSFILSEQYRNLIKALASDEDPAGDQQVVENSPMEERQLSGDSVSSNDSAVGALNVGEHSSYARKKLDQLQERFDNKTQALQALRASLKPESKVLELLQREVVALAGERRRLEAHLARAHTWAQHLGKWRAIVQSAEIVEESQPPQFVLVVQKDEPSGEGENEDQETISTGWVLLRSLTHFQELHRKLRPLCAGVKNLELPSNSFKFLFGKNDKNSLEKAKMQIQKYLDFILEDEHLNQSEAIYAFLSPSSEHLKHNIPSPKKSRFSFSTLFKSGSNESAPRGERGELPIRESGEDDEISLYLDGESGEAATKAVTTGNRGILGVQSGNNDDGKDAIAEPLYTLMGEVFDMRGVFKWLRKTLISFVQITYGRTINRQIRDTITWIFSEPMLHYYISIIMKSWWPGGILSKPGEDRTQQMKDETRDLARQQFINNIPEVLTSLMGAQSAQRGAQKIFDTLQNHTQNKQLFYELFELLLIEVFPELKQHM